MRRGWAMVMALMANMAGCGDNLGAPRLVTRASPIVPPEQLVFDRDNEPVALLYADIRRYITRLAPDGFKTIPGTEQLDIRALGTDADGTPLFTVASGLAGSAVFQLRPDATFAQLGGHIASGQAMEPIQSASGARFVQTVDGGRKLPVGGSTWGFTRTVSQTTRARDGSILGMTMQGIVRIAGADDQITVVLPCTAFPVSCLEVKFAGVDRDDRLYFWTEGQPELLVLDPGASALRSLTLAGVDLLGAVGVAPDFVAIQAVVVDDDGGRASTLYIRRSDGARFERVDQAARMELQRPFFAVDREGTMYVADAEWLGTIELDPAGAE